MGRTPIRARDSVGFVANRCARPFTLESLRMLGEGVADHEEIDRVCRLGGGFRMGPFELMDLIGIDVNFARRPLLLRAVLRRAALAPAPDPGADGRLGPARAQDRAAASTPTSRASPIASATPTSRPSGRSSTRPSSSRSPAPLAPRSWAGSAPRSRTRPASRSARASPRAEDIDTAMTARLQLAARPARVGRAARLGAGARHPRGAARAARRGLPPCPALRHLAGGRAPRAIFFFFFFLHLPFFSLKPFLHFLGAGVRRRARGCAAGSWASGRVRR